MKSLQLSGFKRIRVALKDPSEPRNMRIIAVVSWRSFIVIGIVIVLLSVGYGFVKFQATLQTLENANGQSTAAKAKFNRADFDRTVAGFGARKLQYEVILAARTAIADPSN